MAKVPIHHKRVGEPPRSWEVDTDTLWQFRTQLCAQCSREMVYAFRGESKDIRICSGCEPATFESACEEARRCMFLACERRPFDFAQGEPTLIEGREAVGS